MSPEKLVIDAESIAMARRMLVGMKTPTETLATGFYEGVNFKGGDFLKQRITMQLFQQEQYLPGPAIDRGSIRDWKSHGKLDAFGRAKLEVNKLLTSYQYPDLNLGREAALHHFVSNLAKKAGMSRLPSFD